MLETPARLLRLLSLLQMHRDWSGPELAERLAVTTRTVRRDVERLRDLGYLVHATMGPVGGYRLAAGTTLPPLLLDDDEAVAVTVGLRTSATSNVAGIEEASLRALAKVEQVLPSRLRHRVEALEGAIVAMPPRSEPTVDTTVLTAVAAAIRAADSLRFDYLSHHGIPSRRTVEPHRLVCWGHRWYLVGWDGERANWRTFRADRMSLLTPNGPRFTHREPPDGDVAAYLRRTIGHDMWPYRSRLVMHAPAAQITGRVGGIITPIDELTCLLELASDSLDLVALVVGMLDIDFEVESPPELAQHLRKLSGRFASAAARHPGDSPASAGAASQALPESVQEAQRALQHQRRGVGVVGRQRAVGEQVLVARVDEQLGQLRPDDLDQLAGGVDVALKPEERVLVGAVDLHRDTLRPRPERPLASDRDARLVQQCPARPLRAVRRRTRAPRP
jgi:predicted DNA-binding transcriptional regulator YafY